MDIIVNTLINKYTTCNILHAMNDLVCREEVLNKKCKNNLYSYYNSRVKMQHFNTKKSKKWSYFFCYSCLFYLICVINVNIVITLNFMVLMVCEIFLFHVKMPKITYPLTYKTLKLDNNY